MHTSLARRYLPNKLLLTWLGILLLYLSGAFYISYFWLNPPPDVFRLPQGQLIISPAKYPEQLHGLPQKTVNLPDWDSADQFQQTSLWYLIPFKINHPTPQKLAVYLPRPSQNAEVFLNQQWLGNGGSMQSPISRNRNHNLIFNIDGSLVASQHNVLAIHLVGQLPSHTYLGQVYVGPEHLLRNHAQQSKHLHIDLISVITLCLLFTSIFISILWLFRQSDTYYLWYAAFSLLWTLHDYNHFLKNLPLSLNLWETLSPLSFGLSMLCVVLFVHRYSSHYSASIERMMVAYIVILILPFLYQDLNWIMLYGYMIWSPGIALLGVYALHFVYDCYQRTQQERMVPIFIGGGAIMIFGIHDLLLALQIIPKYSPYMIHFAALFIIAVITTTLINRFVNSMNVVEYYNQQLQREVRRKTDDMEQSYQQVQALTQKYTVAEERQRIMRDIHDGIGGQLVAILAGLDSGELDRDKLKTDIKSALQDLRMVIDSLDYEAEDLPTLLGMLRMRLSGQLSHAKLKLHWQVEELPRIPHFGPAKVLNTMRIIQEAITNTIKHSQANNLTISTALTQDNNEVHYACIRVKDDGCGFLPAKLQGRGLLNMQKRAEMIGAKLYFVATPKEGFTVELKLPVSKQPDA